MDQKHRLLTGRNAVKFVVAASATVLITVVVLTVFATRTTQRDSTPKVDYVTQAAHRILNCTNPDGKCTKRNQKRLAEQIKQLIDAEAFNAARAASAGAYCSQQHLDSYPENLNCVLTQMGLNK